eukprot:scaffold31303_cov48-Prasinocladus_malaysianus.AAC.1
MCALSELYKTYVMRLATGIGSLSNERGGSSTKTSCQELKCQASKRADAISERRQRPCARKIRTAEGGLGRNH